MFSGIFHHTVHVLFCPMGGEPAGNKQHRNESFLDSVNPFLPIFLEHLSYLSD